jgi:hypothetical protein
LVVPVLTLAVLLAFGVSTADASKVHEFKETFGATSQPSFVHDEGMAVDPSSGDLLVIDIGQNEVQSLTVAATAGQFKLTFGSETTGNVAFNATFSVVQEKLEKLSLIGKNNVLVNGGPGDATGSSPYLITFVGSLARTDVEQIGCINGTTPLSGGSGCSVTTTAQGARPSLFRFKPNGEPDPFAALGTNAIDGKRGTGGKPCAEEASSCDETPGNGGTLSSPFNTPSEVEVAVDDSGGETDGDIYLTDAAAHAIEIFKPNGEYAGRLTEYKEGPAAEGSAKPLGISCGVAVDAGGAVYVGDLSENQVHKYVPSAHSPTDLADSEDNTANFSTVIGTYSPEHPEPCSVAAGVGPSAGYVFAAQWTAEKAIKLDASTGALKYELGSGLSEGSVVSVELVNGRVLAANLNGVGSKMISEWDASGATEAKLFSTIELPFHPEGFAADAGGNIYISRAGSDKIEVYGPPITIPGVVTKPATAITGTSATLNGTVNPDGVELTECLFEYGTSTAYDHTVSCAETLAAIGSGETPVPVHADISSLSGGTEYHFRLRAANPNGGNEGKDEPFKAINPVVTKPASNITDNTATLNGTVNPSGQELTECSFEYGTTTTYGQTVPCAEMPAAIGSGETPVPVHADIGALAPNGAKYHFRLLAVSTVIGTAKGEDEEFPTAIVAITEPASEIESEAATLNGKVNPYGKSTECSFEYGTTTAYGQTVPCAESPAEIGSGEAPVPVHADIGDLNPGTIHHFRLRAVNSGGVSPGADKTLQTLGPLIAATWAQGVGFTEATLKAQIDPEGAATTYRFQYGDQGPCDANPCTETSALPVGADSTLHTVGTVLEGLKPGTVYHYRVLAESSVALDKGPDRALATYVHPGTDGCPNAPFRTGPGAGLPDCRAYEMVSPVDKNGGDVFAVTSVGGPTNFTQAAIEGGKITYTSVTAFADAARGAFANQYISTRDAGGWSTHALNPPQGRTVTDPGFNTGVDLQNAFLAFTPDLCEALMVDQNLEPLLPEAIHNYTNLYWRDNCGAGADSYETVTRNQPPISSPTGADLGLAARNHSGDRCEVVFPSPAALTADAAPAKETVAQIYDFSCDGVRHLVSMLPNGEASSINNSVGTTSGDAPRQSTLANAVSADASRAFWTASPDGPGSLYVRLNPGEDETAQVDGKGNCVPDPVLACTVAIAAGARFWTADSEGNVAVFSAGSNLYEYDVASETKTQIAGKAGGVVGGSEDLSRLYFTSEEALAAGAAAGQMNLYLREGAGNVFIATLAAADSGHGGNGGIDSASPATRSSRLSPDGRHLAFTSQSGALALTVAGYDNADQATGEPDPEVYVYDADTARLSCASCNPSGARPVGASRVAGWQWSNNGNHPLASDGSRLFFESSDALLPTDTNGQKDVYEWEAPGAGPSPGGHCDEASPSFSPLDVNGGCIGLISTGHSPKDSLFVDASADGRDTFISTASSIDPRDPGLIDVYDAREGGGFPAPEPEPTPCVGDACQSVPTPPGAQSPASEGFKGPGNLQETPKPGCARGKVRRHGKCVKKRQGAKRKRHHSRKGQR